MVDYRLLAALAAVIEQGGFERAARHLHLTQSAISQRIRQLELQLGQPVLRRTTPPDPTELGRRLSNHYQQVRQLEAGLMLEDRPEDELQWVRLTVNADSLGTWLPAALSRIGILNRVQFDLVVEDQDVGLNRMKRGEVMACLCSSAQAVNGGKVSYLGKMRYRALISPMLLKEYPQPLTTAVLSRVPCLVFSRDDRLQHRFLQEQLGAGQPQQIHLCPSADGFVQMALNGLGFGMMPELQVRQHLDAGRLVDLVPGQVLDIPLYWHYWQTESPLLARLRQAVQQEAIQVLS